MPDKPFHRRQIAWPLRCAIGIAIDAGVAPIVWATEKPGRGDVIFRAMRKPELRRLAKFLPFEGYAPGARDIVVMVYGKSGTNWTPADAQQWLHRGEAEFDHIPCMVAWPEAKNAPPLRNYAIPFEDESPWRNSPEGRHVIKTHLKWEHIPWSEEARYISVIRDPKDVFVSSYFFLRGMIPLPSVETWARLFRSDDFYAFGSWAVRTTGMSFRGIRRPA